MPFQITKFDRKRPRKNRQKSKKKKKTKLIKEEKVAVTA